MSELKAGVLVTPHDEGMCFHRGEDVVSVTERETEFYLKSEADKVIAEKDEKIENLEEYIKELQKATDSAWSKANAMYDELRHSNRKRCLSMAKYCELREDEFGGDFAKRWLKRWLALAEEPTWAKFLQLIRKEAK